MDCYKIKERSLKGFNSIFTVSSIDVAKRYYAEFSRQIEVLPSDKKLKIATIYSFNVNEEEIDGLLKTINNIGEKFSFNNDFIMRTCLFCTFSLPEMRSTASQVSCVPKTIWDAE